MKSHRVDAAIFARSAVVASQRHLLVSVVACAAAAAWNLRIDPQPAALAVIAAIGAALVAYNILRIRSARRALTSEAEGRRFVLAQRRSHLVRGTVYLVAAPLVLALVWIGVLIRGGESIDRLAVLGVVSVVIAYGMVWWSRALPRARRWQV